MVFKTLPLHLNFKKKVTLTWHVNRARYDSQFLLGIIGFQKKIYKVSSGTTTTIEH
jgi:hypothetical protein